MSAEIDRDIAEGDSAENEEVTAGVAGPDDQDLTSGQTPAQEAADDETRAPEQEGSENPRPS